MRPFFSIFIWMFFASVTARGIVLDPPPTIMPQMSPSNAGGAEATSCQTATTNAFSQLQTQDAASAASIAGADSSAPTPDGTNPTANQSVANASLGKGALSALQSTFAPLQAACTSACAKAKSAISAIRVPAEGDSGYNAQLEQAVQTNLQVVQAYSAYCSSEGAKVVGSLATSESGMNEAMMGSMMVSQLSSALSGSSNKNSTGSSDVANTADPTVTAPATVGAVSTTTTTASTGSGSTSTSALTTASGFAPATTTATTTTQTVQSAMAADGTTNSTPGTAAVSADTNRTNAKVYAAAAPASFYSSSTPLSGYTCQKMIAAGAPLLNSMQCLNGLQNVCVPTQTQTNSVCDSFTKFYCATGSYNTTLLSASGTIPPGSGQGTPYSNANAIMNAHGLTPLSYCQKVRAISYCANPANSQCMSCISLRGATSVTAQTVLNAKGSCLSDPNYTPLVYDTLLSVLPPAAAPSAPRVQPASYSVIGRNPNL